jgi:hypothetical protein
VLQKFETIHAWHAEVGKDRGKFQVLKLPRSFDSVRSGLNGETLAAQCRFKGRLHLDIVINN